MKVVENENALKIIKALVPSSILDLNPVIAGGFIVSLYHLAIRYSSELYDDDLAIRIERAISEYWKARDNFLSNLNLDKKFGDIDFWFLKNNDIWNSDNILIKDFEEDEELVKEDSFSPIFAKKKTDYYKIYYNTVDKLIEEDKEAFIKFGLQKKIINSSYWANSFITDSYRESKVNKKQLLASINIQIIKKQYETIDELFSKFDIINCCAAYYDGKFYFHDEFEDCSNKHILEAGDSFVKATALSKIWAAGRSFKYANRFNLEFSEEVCENIVETFIEADILIKKIIAKEYDQVTECINLEGVDGIDDPYGRNGIIPVDKLVGMINSLFSYTAALFSMKQFNQDRMFLFVNSSNPSAKEYLKNYFDSESDKFQGQNIVEGLESICYIPLI